MQRWSFVTLILVTTALAFSLAGLVFAQESTPEAVTMTDPMDVCPDGVSEIAFVSDRDGNPEIYVMNADGTNLRRLTESPRDDIVTGWSPDGAQILFHSNRDGFSNVYVMNADGSDVRRLTDNTMDSFSPAMSPDGSQIVFHAFAEITGNDANLWVMNADGSRPRRLTNLPSYEAWGKFSPDGAQIALNSDAGGSLDIYVMNADGSDMHNLTGDAADDGPPIWSADGSQILFWSERDYPYAEAYVMNSDGSNVRRLTANTDIDYITSWSPDERYAVFMSDRDGNFEIYVMNADGGNPQRLTDHPGEDIDPYWRPCAPVVEAPETTAEATGAPVATCTITAPSSVNMRGGPGTNFNVRGSLAVGAEAQADGQALGADGNNWWRLTDGNWVRSDVVDESGDCAALPVVPAS